jgi:hypothetical protein
VDESGMITAQVGTHSRSENGRSAQADGSVYTTVLNESIFLSHHRRNLLTYSLL